jgi:hypothetical protein
MNFYDQITQYENFLPHDMLHEATSYLQRPNWGIQKSRNDYKSYKLFWVMNLLQDDFFTRDIFKLITDVIGDRKLINVHANAQSFGQDGVPHVDFDTDEAQSFLIYLNDDWDIQWGGETYFLDRYSINGIETQISNQLMSVLPVPNRAICFPSNMFHFGSSPKRDFYGIRYTIRYILKK